MVVGWCKAMPAVQDLRVPIPDTVEAADTLQTDTVEADTTQGRYLKITTSDGSTFQGQVLRENDKKIVLKHKVGIFSIYKNEIKKMKPYDPADKTSLWFSNPNENRMFVMPTARMLEAGEGYYQNMYVLISSMSIGITDFITASMGVSMIPAIGLDNQLLFGSLKAGTELAEKFHGAAGVTFLNVENEQSTFSYGMLTYGSPDYQLSVGYGTSLGSDGIDNQTNLLILGGEARLSEHIAIASENWVGEEQIISYGIRFFGEKVSADLAFFRPLNELVDAFGPLGIPYVDFVYFF